MPEITSVEAQKNFGEFRVMAEREPVFVLHYNKPSVVILAADEYARLKRRDRKVVATEDLPDWLAEKITGARMDPRHAHLNESEAPVAPPRT